MRSTFMLGLLAYDRAMRCMGAGQQLWQDQHRCAGDDVCAEMLVGGHAAIEEHGTSAVADRSGHNEVGAPGPLDRRAGAHEASFPSGYRSDAAVQPVHTSTTQMCVCSSFYAEHWVRYRIRLVSARHGGY